MLVGMSLKTWRPAGCVERGPGISQAAWGWIGLWAGAATVLGLAAAAIEPIAERGRGAVIFAGVGGACAVALAFAAMMLAAGAALAKWRRSRPFSGAAVPASRLPAPPLPNGDPILGELVAGLAARVARLDKQVETAIRGAAAPASKGDDAGLASAHEDAVRGAQRLASRLDAIEAGTRAEAEAVELRSKTRLNALAEAVLPRVNVLDDDLARLRRAFVESETRLRDFEKQVFDLLRARDAGETLRRLDSEASKLFDKLFDADERHYGMASAWQADYASWKSHINKFWDILRGYSTDVEQPFAVTDSEVGHADELPDSPLFATQEMRSCYRMMVVVQERHMNFRENAFSFNAEKGRPPEPNAAPAQHRPAPPMKARQPAASGRLVA